MASALNHHNACLLHSLAYCGYNERQRKTFYETVSESDCGTNPLALRKKNEGGQMPKEAELKSVQFPPFMSLARGTFLSFPPSMLFC